MGEVWKYKIALEDYLTLSMPRRAQVLTVQVQNRIPQLWALVDPSRPKVPQVFRVARTGHPIFDYPEENLGYVGTFQLQEGSANRAFHVFEVLQEA